MTAPSAPRTIADRCPGLLRPHLAADGALVRLRIPGGSVTTSSLTEIGAVAEEFGSGGVQLTSRGNLQVRGVSLDEIGEVPVALAARLQRVGLLPSITHELVRNVICSPLTGLAGGLADLRSLTVRLDELMCTTERLAGLPGRFLFALDDGRDDVAVLEHDLGVRAVAADRVALLVAGATGPVVAMDDAAAHLVRLALEFLRIRGAGPSAVWRVAELPGAGRELLPDGPADDGAVRSIPAPPATSLRCGVFRQDDGRSLISLTVPLSTLTAAQLDAVVTVAAHVVVVTPWRGLVLPHLDPAAAPAAADLLAAAGLVLHEDSGWRRVTACVGAPGCRKAAAPTRPTAVQLAEKPAAAGGLPIHVVACARRCGSPTVEHVEVLLSGSGRATSSIRGSRPAERITR